MTPIHTHATRVRAVFCLAVASLLFTTSAAAIDLTLSPAVHAGIELKFGGTRAFAHETNLNFAAGYAVPMRGADPTDSPQVDRIDLEQPLLPLIDASFSERHVTDAIHFAGFRISHADENSRADYNDDTPSWWGRNWWWVALAGAAAVAGTALAGGSHSDNNNNNPGPSPSGCQRPNGVSGDVIGPQPLMVDCTPVPGT